MHTLLVILGGFALLALCLLVARLAGASRRRAILVFLPLWLIGAAVNMWIGVATAGYSVAEEFPIFLAIFAVPAIVAGLLYRKLR
ncbi:hypothetical protein [Luteimonas aquatica]|uniref:hypothetical protein n=1 Tax=Luteimonas aquatica TaxID=450364 RepID=UPI001F59BE5F|nr:hypothetical protein [Luteimonas aquatica]